MNWRTVRAIATKDLLEVRKNRIAISVDPRDSRSSSRSECPS